MWAVARADARVMRELQAAASRSAAETAGSEAAVRTDNTPTLATPLTFPNGSVALRNALPERGARRSNYC